MASKLSLIVLATLFLGFFDLSYDRQTEIFSATPESFAEQSVHLGLDLQGGTQLDYKIDLRKVNEEDKEQIIEGVLEVINKRVNGLGVSEPNIYQSQVAEEEHIIVELAGIQDLEEAKNIVGKTIQLEFKEQGDENLSGENINEIENNANALLTRILDGEDFSTLGATADEADPDHVMYFAGDESYIFADQMADDFIPAIEAIENGETYPKVIRTNDGYTIDASGNLIPMEGFFILKLVDQQEGARETSDDKEVQASHILIGHESSDEAVGAITRTQEEAYALAEELLERVNNGEDFAELAKEYSDESSAEETGGDLGFFGPGMMVETFENEAFTMEIGEVSEIIETKFGYHIITVTDIKEATITTTPETEYQIERIFFSIASENWIETELTGEHFVRADVEFSQTYTPYVNILFNDEGSDLFEEITSRNVGKPLAIFVGGEMISSPNVNEAISGGRAQISGNFTVEEASELARDLNTGAIPAPIILVGQYTIGATLGQSALDSSVQAGLIGLLLLAVYMVLYYRVPGLMANLALFMYAVLLLFFIKVSMPLGWALAISLTVFCFLLSAVLKNKDSGWEKLLSFLLACFILFFLTYLLSNPIVLTLAGVAGVVLSIGMAVDANVLIFERMREELRNKRPLAGAIEVGFDRAWSSIRDSNYSSLITCAILIYFGSSIIKGFAVNLALGILISMFTAITITKTLLKAIATTKIADNALLLGTPKRSHPKLPIVQMKKVWFSISGVLIVTALVVIPMNGLKFGLDFTGGTLLELEFENTVETSAITEILETIELELLGESETTSSPEEAPTLDAETIELSALEEDKEIPVDFGEPIVVSSGENSVIIRMKHISNESHETILATIAETLGEFEETRFTTIGPTIGSTMKEKALIALGVALITIVFYIAFAFRKIPKSVSPWRFGLTAIVALVHDVLITLGIFVVLGSVLGVEIDALFVTALLTIMGFSVHDTIVTFDRIRENLRHQKAGEAFEEVANRAVNETIARSINTSISTLFTIAALFFLGAGSIHWFLFALIVGLLAGTYSSIFTATPLLVWWTNRSNK